MKKLLILFVMVMLAGCRTSTTVIQENKFYQTNYSNEECYSGDKTFSQIIICMQNNSNKEISQNNITNDLLSKK